MQAPDHQTRGEAGVAQASDAAAPQLYTIGHGKRTIAEFLAALHASGVRAVADVRRYPRSRANPQFNAESLATTLSAAGIAYAHHERLGGRRSATRADSPNAAWTHPAFRAYADYMMEDEFWNALDVLLRGARREPTAVMCSETLWWRCHRRLIADAATARGFRVTHIMRPGVVAAHVLSPHGRVIGEKISYTGTKD